MEFLDCIKNDNIDLNVLIKELETLGENIIIYNSHLEGLGTKNSDYDVYILESFSDDLVREKIISNKYFDIEFWKYEDIKNILTSIENNEIFKLKLEDLKFLKRLESGYALKSNDFGKDILKHIEKIDINIIGSKLFQLFSNSQYEDSRALYEDKYYYSALDCARKSLEYAIASYNSISGNANFKEKWISTIFLTMNKNEKYLKKYLNLQYFNSINEDNIKLHIEEILEFVQEIISYISMNIVRSEMFV